MTTGGKDFPFRANALPLTRPRLYFASKWLLKVLLLADDKQVAHPDKRAAYVYKRRRRLSREGSESHVKAQQIDEPSGGSAYGAHGCFPNWRSAPVEVFLPLTFIQWRETLVGGNLYYGFPEGLGRDV